MTLQIVLRQEIGRKSEGRDAFNFLGIRTRFAAFHCFKRQPERKNSRMASVTSGPITGQEAIKNSVEYPSGPPDLFLGKEKKAFRTSSAVKALSKLATWFKASDLVRRAFKVEQQVQVALSEHWWRNRASKQVRKIINAQVLDAFLRFYSLPCFGQQEMDVIFSLASSSISVKKTRVSISTREPANM